MRIPRNLLLVAMAIALWAATASAGVQVRIGVTPHTLQHCGQGHLALALWNDGVDPLRVHVYVSLTYADSVLIGPRPLRTRLGSHELKSHEFDFPVLPMLPTGRYVLTMLAVGSDSSRSLTAAPFVVEPSACTVDGAPAIPPALLLNAIAEGTGLDIPTPTVQATWGQVKRRFDPGPR